MGACLAHLTRGTVCLRTASVEWNVPGKYEPHGEHDFFLNQLEPAAMSGSEIFSPCSLLTSAPPFFSADVLKKCALIGTHLMAEEGRVESSGFRTPDVGDMWRCGCPKSPIW